MQQKPTNEASQYLLRLAKRNAQAYIAQPSTKAIIVTGSAVEGLSDLYSDVDMIVYHDELPTEEALLMACQQNQGEGRRLFGELSSDAMMETYLVHGVECQVAHTTITAWERDMASVLEQFDVTSPLQKALSGLLEAQPLYGEPLIRQWQAKIADYPDGLALAMVEHYLAFTPIWGLQGRFAVRDATIWEHQLVVEAAYHLLGLLAGLNRLYYTSFQFKRMHHFVEQMHITPLDLASRLDAIFHRNFTSATMELKNLFQEAVTLVEQVMPTVDTTAAQQKIAWQQQAWTLRSEEGNP